MTKLLAFREDRKLACVIAASVFYRLAHFRQSWIQDDDYFLVQTGAEILRSIIDGDSLEIEDSLIDRLFSYYPEEDEKVVFELESFAVLCFEEAVNVLRGGNLKYEIFDHFLETVFGTIQVSEYGGVITDEVKQKVVSDNRFEVQVRFLEDLHRKCDEFGRESEIGIFAPEFAHESTVRTG